MSPRPLLILFLLALLCPVVAAAEEADLLIADFEGPDYGEWKASGGALGSGPAQGTLPGQMQVSGFEGKGLVNTYRGGDKSTGKLVSPPFTIERPFINFLIGGGKHPRKTCMNLLVDGKAVRTATGENAKPGGSERLALGDVGRKRPPRKGSPAGNRRHGDRRMGARQRRPDRPKRPAARGDAG